MPVVVACCQLAPVFGEPKKNRARAEKSVRIAVENGASVVVLPELACTGYLADEQAAFDCAENCEGPTISSWTRLAAAYGIVIVGGFCEVSDGQLFNSVVLVDADGLRSKYRKAHLWHSDLTYFASGDAEPPVVDTRFGRIAMMICYDLDFPEWVRIAALKGAQLVCAPTNWPEGNRPVGAVPMEIVRIQASASVNRFFIAACDRAGSEGGMNWVGASTIVDINGWVLSSAWQLGGSSPGITYAVCDLERASSKDVGPYNNVHTDRRPLLYHGLVAGPGSPT